MEIYQSAKMPSTGKSCSQNCCCRGTGRQQWTTVLRHYTTSLGNLSGIH